MVKILFLRLEDRDSLNLTFLAAQVCYKMKIKQTSIMLMVRSLMMTVGKYLPIAVTTDHTAMKKV